MWKPALAFGLSIAAAAGVGWWLSSLERPEPAPTIIIQAPAAPAVVPAALPTPAAEPTPAPVVVKPKREVRKTAKAVPAPVPTPAPVEEKPAEPEPVMVTSVAEPTPAPAPTSTKPEPPPAKRIPRLVTIPAGTLITVRLNQELSSTYSADSQTFTASLDQPLVIDGLVIAERGSKQEGRVTQSDPAGRVKGRASLGVALTRLRTADGQTVEVSTDTFVHEAESTVKRDMAKTGIAAAIGAAIGAIAGGGKGAAIGAGVGGAAGAGGVLATKGKDARLPAETRIAFRLNKPVTLTEQFN